MIYGIKNEQILMNLQFMVKKKEEVVLLAIKNDKSKIFKVYKETLLSDL